MNGSGYYYSIMIVLLTTIWFRFPPGWRNNLLFRKRLKSYLLVPAFGMSIYLHYMIVTIVLISLQGHYEWVIAILLPFMRELECWISTKLALKAACGDITAMKIVIAFERNINHSIALSYMLGSIASDTTCILVLIFDFLFNLSIGIRIIWMARKRPENKEKIIELLQELVIAEMVEFITPLVYLACFCTAYYGPNAHLLGNIRNGYFQYVAVEDVGRNVKNVLWFFCIELLSCTACSLILWIWCHINLFRVYIALQKEFGPVFLAMLVALVSGVSKQLTIQTNLKTK